MKDHQLGYTLPLQPLGAKIERHQATPEDRRAIELCKFEQKRHGIKQPTTIKQRRDREQFAFEQWLYCARPSGDVEDVQCQWEASYMRECWEDEEAELYGEPNEQA